MQNNCSFQVFRQAANILVVFGDLLDSIVGPVILEVVVDLLHQIRVQRLILSKPQKQLHPIVQLIGAVFRTVIEIE